MSASLRDRRVRIYRYENSGGQGLVSARYVFSTERWASIVQVAATKQIVGIAPNEKISAVMDFDPAVDVQQNDLLVEGSDKYFVRGRREQRTPPALLVGAELITEEVFQALTVEDDDWTPPVDVDDATYSTSVVES